MHVKELSVAINCYDIISFKPNKVCLEMVLCPFFRHENQVSNR